MTSYADLLFNAGNLGDPSDEYVAWVDVMGIQGSLGRSVRVAANFVYKMHHAALSYEGQGVTLYPVMDGLYVCCNSSETMTELLAFIFRSVAHEFVKQTENKFRFVIRGAVAKGDIYHGKSLSSEASWTLGQHSEYRNQILLGLPMVQAHLGEPEAPPFGIFVDSSVSDFPGGKFPFDVWWAWYKESDADLVAKLRSGLESYYDWCAANPGESGYETSRIRIHRGQASLYLREG